MLTDKEKQIEEMAQAIHDVAEAHNIIWCTELAKVLCNAGYRKQSKGEWIEDTECYADDYSEFNTRKVYACSLCGRTERRKQPYCNCGAKMKGDAE